MKKMMVAGFLAVCMIAVSQQQASAWINSKFGVGLNWDFQSGGNSLAWGLWRDGQPPGPEAFGGHGHGQGYGYPRFGGMPYGNQPFAPGAMPVPQFAPGAVPAPVPVPVAPVLPGSAFYPQPNQFMEPNYFGQLNTGNPYQFANYPRPMYYYPQPTWYGR